MKKFFSFLVVIFFILLCLPVKSMETKEENVFNTWYEIYYEAETFMKIGKWRDAIDDYYLVLVKQKKDRKNARTYGMNFIREFTPNRDLGIAYYQIGEFESAEQYLEISCQQLPTELGKEYLEKTKLELQKNMMAEEYFKKGVNHFDRKEYELAIKEMEEVLKLRPDYNIARKYIERARSLQEIINTRKKVKK